MTHLVVRFRLRISTSIFPVPSVCAADQMSDWFGSLASCLHWNVRRQQKALEPSASSVSLQEGASKLSLNNGVQSSATS